MNVPFIDRVLIAMGGIIIALVVYKGLEALFS